MEARREHAVWLRQAGFLLHADNLFQLKHPCEARASCSILPWHLVFDGVQAARRVGETATRLQQGQPANRAESPDLQAMASVHLTQEPSYNPHPPGFALFARARRFRGPAAPPPVGLCCQSPHPCSAGPGRGGGAGCGSSATGNARSTATKSAGSSATCRPHCTARRTRRGRRATRGPPSGTRCTDLHDYPPLMEWRKSAI